MHVFEFDEPVRHLPHSNKSAITVDIFFPIVYEKTFLGPGRLHTYIII